jgi:hypothetical protein
MEQVKISERGYKVAMLMTQRETEEKTVNRLFDQLAIYTRNMAELKERINNTVSVIERLDDEIANLIEYK